MNKYFYFLIIFLLVISSTSFAASIHWISSSVLNPSPIVATDINQINMKLEIVDNTAIPITSRLVGKVGNTIIYDSNIPLIPYVITTVYVDWNKNLLDFNFGSKKVDFNAYNDGNLEDVNSSSISFEIKRGRNLKVNSFASNQIVYSPGSSALLTYQLQNIGDIGIAQDFNACLVIDGVKDGCQGFNGLGAGASATKDFNYTLPSIEDLFNVKLVLDYFNNVLEYDKSDNNSTITLSTISGIDLAVTSIDVNSMIEKTQGKIKAKVSNLGSQNATNIKVVAFVGIDSNKNLSYYDVINLNSGETKEIYFYYIPIVAGFDVVTVLLDPDNLVAESKKSNNSMQKGFPISVAQAEGSTAFTTTLDIDKECVAVISNNDKLLSKGIMDDNGVRVVDILFYDADGTTLVQKKMAEGTEEVLPGRTIRIIRISEVEAKVMLIYQQQKTLLYTNCFLDYAQEKKRAESMEQSFLKCQEQFATKDVELRSCEMEKTTSLTEYNTCQAQLQTKDTELANQKIIDSNLQAALVLTQNSCDDKIKSNVNVAMVTMQAVVDEKESKIVSAKSDIAFRNWILFFILIFITLFSIYYLYKKHYFK